MAWISRVLPLGLLLLAACGADEGKPHASFPQGGDPAPAMPPAQPQKPFVVKELKRQDVKDAIQRGPGYFLQNVALDENVVMINGKFHGWVLRGINELWIIDLNPGDVITKVNGIVPEKPDDAVTALQSLEKAKSLKVEYERDGKPRTLELPIID
jgi:type II secretory pathway component PulC